MTHSRKSGFAKGSYAARLALPPLTSIPMSRDDPRRIERLTKETLALILAGGQGSRLHDLTIWRAKPAVPFGGKFRIIDFALSNCINSNIRRIGVATQYKSHSLVRHLVRGWSGFKAEFNEFVEVLPASMRLDDNSWYKGTADAVYQNLDIIRTHTPEFVLILGGDHIYKMDYGPLIAQHDDTGAALTVCCIEVDAAEAAGAFGVLKIDETGKVLEFQEKPAVPAEIPGKPGRVLASMGNYVFNRETLFEQLILDADDESSAHDFGQNILPCMVAEKNVYAFRLGDDQPSGHAYWRDVGTIDAYWEANMELVDFSPELDLWDRTWPIYTHQMQLASAKFVHDEEGRRGMALNCLISGGCIVSGAEVSQSLLFSNVHVRSYSEVFKSVLLPNVKIGRNVKIRKAIIDSGTHIPDDTEIGIKKVDDLARGFHVSPEGITLVTPSHFQQTIHRVR